MYFYGSMYSFSLPRTFHNWNGQRILWADRRESTSEEANVQKVEIHVSVNVKRDKSRKQSFPIKQKRNKNHRVTIWTRFSLSLCFVLEYYGRMRFDEAVTSRRCEPCVVDEALERTDGVWDCRRLCAVLRREGVRRLSNADCWRTGTSTQDEAINSTRPTYWKKLAEIPVREDEPID